jgi:choline dehydrogenase-like flavoprotein
MTREAAPFSTTELCQSRDLGNLWLVDGATFPFLPAKNITFTLMANAVRVAEAAFA